MHILECTTDFTFYFGFSILKLKLIPARVLPVHSFQDQLHFLLSISSLSISMSSLARSFVRSRFSKWKPQSQIGNAQSPPKNCKKSKLQSRWPYEDDEEEEPALTPPTPRDSRRLPDWDTRRTPPKQADVNGECQAIKFKGRVVYSRTVAEVEKATTELLGTIESKGNGLDPIALGFDIEWRPTFRRGVAPRKAAVMQICADASTCYVMHIIHSGIPSSLQSLLEDPKYVKVGVSIANDAVKIWKDYKVCVKSVKELSSLANLKVRGDPRNWSLSSLTEMLNCKQLEKPNKLRLGNWEAQILSMGQLQYAATDAFVSWHLYQHEHGWALARSLAGAQWRLGTSTVAVLSMSTCKFLWHEQGRALAGRALAGSFGTSKGAPWQEQGRALADSFGTSKAAPWHEQSIPWQGLTKLDLGVDQIKGRHGHGSKGDPRACLEQPCQGKTHGRTMVPANPSRWDSDRTEPLLAPRVPWRAARHHQSDPVPRTRRTMGLDGPSQGGSRRLCNYLGHGPRHDQGMYENVPSTLRMCQLTSDCGGCGIR
ncbi:hypothetical protein Scep_010669 [Stephania cephalantha]|uniref:3'-5' exonuclease n=1 Tax=Stephania cephalantha TaxID=152367 RepID=A0AAP0JWT2_9MAGN